MPFIKIFIDKSISKDTKETISNSIHLALVECFNIPLKDKFQVFIEVDKDNMILVPQSDRAHEANHRSSCRSGS